jgi:Tfp pilus assembly protein PilE
MKHVSRTQHGMTLGGLIIVLGFIAVLVTFAVRAFPLYNEKMQIVAALNSVASQPDAARMSERDARSRFLKNITATTNIDRFNDRNIKQYLNIVGGKSGEPKSIHFVYESRNKLVADLQLLLSFDRKIPLRGNAGGE